VTTLRNSSVEWAARKSASDAQLATLIHRSRLSAAEFERLVSALAMVVGWEALIVLGDIRGLSEKEQLDTALWTARTLVRAALEEGST
jgi:regulator of RNase E activity RraA